MNRTDLLKIEVKQAKGVFYYTGTIEKINSEEVLIKTIRSEELIFRKEQITKKEKLNRTANEDNKKF